jgi:two-component system, NtrC family, nitrogen regulation sensor histidine kinase GlnL
MSSVSQETAFLRRSDPWNPAQKAAEKNQQLDRLANLGMLSASMSHEIKNGLQAVRTFVDVLLEKNPNEELGELVRHELDRVNAIVTQILRIAAPGSASFKAVRSHDLLEHSLRLLKPHASMKLINLQKKYHAAPDTVHGDDALLQQVIMNLLFNAVDAMGPNGTLTVGTEIGESEEGARVLKIHIQDTGMGIAPENAARLFEPFFTTKKNGTGLGLAICQRIIQQHRGIIHAQSEAGLGSTFTIHLPVNAG